MISATHLSQFNLEIITLHSFPSLETWSLNLLPW